MNPIAKALLATFALTCIGACMGAQESRKETADQVRDECRDTRCPGDVYPDHDATTESIFKLNGQWYVAPKKYGGYNGSGADLAFFWPSRTSARGLISAKEAPEFVPSGPGQASNFYDVAIEIFLRSTNMPPPDARSWYQDLLAAEAQGRLISRKELRPGLELWRIRRPDGSASGLLYVATQIKGPDGDPPVVGCDEGNSTFSRCTTGLRWRPDVWASLRFNSKHGPDWPEIYQEVIRVLQLIRKV